MRGYLPRSSEDAHLAARNRLSCDLPPSFADMAAGALARGFNTGDWTFFQMIRTSIRADSTGDMQGYGVVKFPTGWKWEPPGGG